MPTSRYCCDIHDPDRFESIAALDVPKEKSSRRTSLKDYTRNSDDLALRDALRRWRVMKTSVKYGMGIAGRYGGCLVLPNEFLERIVDCAHYKKIDTVVELKKQTQWAEADAYGEEILAMIRQHTTVPVPGAWFETIGFACSRSVSEASISSLATTTTNVTGAVSAVIPSRSHATAKPRLTANKCSVCHQSGHIS